MNSDRGKSRERKSRAGKGIALEFLIKCIYKNICPEIGENTSTFP
jgi:hypothetical protein